MGLEKDFFEELECVHKDGLIRGKYIIYERNSEDKRFSDMRLIQELFKSIASKNSGIIDFSESLNTLKDTPFFDWVHLDEIGNKKIAEEMFSVLEPLLKK